MLVDMNGRCFRLFHVEERRQDFVIDRYAGGCGAGFGFGFRNHAGQRVADVAGDFPGLDVDGPVLGVEAEYAFAGDVLGGEDADDAGHGFGLSGADGEHAGAGMSAEHDGPVRHAGRVEIVDERPGAGGALIAAVLGPARSEAGIAVRFGNVAFP